MIDDMKLRCVQGYRHDLQTRLLEAEKSDNRLVRIASVKRPASRQEKAGTPFHLSLSRAFIAAGMIRAMASFIAMESLTPAAW